MTQSKMSSLRSTRFLICLSSLSAVLLTGLSLKAEPKKYKMCRISMLPDDIYRIEYHFPTPDSRNRIYTGVYSEPRAYPLEKDVGFERLPSQKGLYFRFEPSNRYNTLSQRSCNGWIAMVFPCFLSLTADRDYPGYFANDAQFPYGTYSFHDLFQYINVYKVDSSGVGSPICTIPDMPIWEDWIK